MPSASASLTIPVPVEIVYRYLHERYNRPAHHDVLLVAEEPRRLVFSAAARDSLLPISYGGWRWEYELRPMGESATRVTISYRWSWVMSILSSWTVRHQACNEIVETAMALDALGWGQYPAAPPEPAQERPSSEAIRLPPDRVTPGTGRGSL
jgi:hypothetical protein